MSLEEQILQDYKQAFKNKQQQKKDTLNYLIAQLKNKKIQTQKDLDNQDIIAVIKKEIKAIKETINFLEKADKKEEINQENHKIEILSKYLPQMMSKQQLANLVKEKIKQLDIQDINKQRGQLIGTIMGEYKSIVDGSMLNQIINELNS